MTESSLGLENGVVRLVPYDLRWPDLFRDEAARIQAALSVEALHVSLEHMGSTAVPGLAAKPIVDILGGWHSAADREAIIEALKGIGYVHRGEQGIPGREFFRRGDPRQYHFHLAERGGTFWVDHLAFRDLMRSDPERAAEYAALKLRLADEFPRDRGAYIDGKTEFVRGSLERVGRGA